jgi:prophage antirepressor-like protein
MGYEENRLAEILPVRMTTGVYRLMMRQAWDEGKYGSEWVRGIILEALQKRGVAIPEPMTGAREFEEWRRARTTGGNAETVISTTNTNGQVNHDQESGALLQGK